MKVKKVPRGVLLSTAAASLVLAAACAADTARNGSATSADAAPSSDATGPTSPAQDAGATSVDSATDGDANGTDTSSGCPAGSTLRRTRATCPGAPLTPPAPFTASLASASPGDVVSMAGMSESDAPCLPVVVCSPNDAPSMLFSDSPESPAQDGVLYADTPPAGRHRFYVYHANGGSSLRKFPIVALNSGAQPAKITIVRRGLAAPSTAYVSVGKTVLLDWLVDRAPVDVVVPAGQRVVVDPALDQLHASQNQLVHAIYDVVTDAPLKISFVSVAANADAAAVTSGLALLARDVDHQRGTFPAADVLVTAAAVPGGAQKKGVQRLRLGLDEVDDTLEGIDAPTGDKQVLLGNYGMLYRFVLGLPSPATAAIAPRGGGWGGVARVSGSPSSVILPTATEALGTTTDAIVLGPLGSSAEVKLLTGGGSNLPIDLFVVTP